MLFWHDEDQINRDYYTLETDLNYDRKRLNLDVINFINFYYFNLLESLYIFFIFKAKQLNK